MPLLLEALPAQIKKEALSTRCTAVSQRLFATLVASGPGTIKDRSTVLQEVERRNQPTPPLGKLHEELKSWKFSLTRLQLMGFMVPDPIVQLGVLRNMVSALKDHSRDFEFRLHAWEVEHRVSGANRCTQK